VRTRLVPPPAREFGAFGRSLLVPPSRVENPRFIRIGDDVVVHEHTWFCVRPYVDGITPRVEVHDHVRIGRFCQFSVIQELVIEENVVIGDFVQVGDTFHPYDVADRMPALVPPAPVRIGRGATVGSHAVVLPGVTIGAGAYVEHHAVVSRDVPEGAFVSGFPAREVEPA
jgi:acetyltransferase-like isoleucine patch superfamily enzyme